MKKFLFLTAFLLAGFLAQGQLASLDVRKDTLITVSDTININSRVTNVTCNLSAGHLDLTIPAPSADYLGLTVNIIQYGATGADLLILHTMGGGSDFVTSNTPSTTTSYTAATYQFKSFTCLLVAAATYKWVQTN